MTADEELLRVQVALARAQDDMFRAKRQRDHARSELELRDQVVRELQAELIALRVGSRLLRIEDFQRFIGVENVVGADGRIDWREFESRLSGLLRRRPELAAPPTDSRLAG